MRTLTTLAIASCVAIGAVQPALGRDNKGSANTNANGVNAIDRDTGLDRAGNRSLKK